jgi:opacity protein-like surface antigen
MKKYVRAQIAAAILASLSAPAMAEEVSVYVEGFGGYALATQSGSGDIVSGTGFGGDFGSSGTYGGGIGIKIPYANTGFAFRFDITGAATPSLGGSNHTGTLDDGTPVSAKVKTSVTDILGTAYMDMNFGLPVTPYVGFGLGNAHNKIGTVVYSNPAGAFATVNGGNNSGLAWTGTVGASYEVIPNFEVDFGYRYTDAGRIKSGTGFTDLTNGATQTLDQPIASRLQLHQFIATLRYLF